MIREGSQSIDQSPHVRAIGPAEQPPLPWAYGWTFRVSATTLISVVAQHMGEVSPWTAVRFP